MGVRSGLDRDETDMLVLSTCRGRGREAERHSKDARGTSSSAPNVCSRISPVSVSTLALRSGHARHSMLPDATHLHTFALVVSSAGACFLLVRVYGIPRPCLRPVRDSVLSWEERGRWRKTAISVGSARDPGCASCSLPLSSFSSCGVTGRGAPASKSRSRIKRAEGGDS
ncbi:hypothetical protein HJG60_011671 [Phyllostomus discolor]|uniref:Uncharacterized protein n=1 Tax=Phyllostomus discolor TaxID=89673 RepID=A0A834DXK2_9CHIR|nr:hypothetical protein HJG60_011671 [Phyllostomus discolor]